MGKQSETGPIQTEGIDLKKLAAQMEVDKQVRKEKQEQMKPKKYKFTPPDLHQTEKVTESKMVINDSTKTDLRTSGTFMSYAQSSINKLQQVTSLLKRKVPTTSVKVESPLVNPSLRNLLIDNIPASKNTVALDNIGSRELQSQLFYAQKALKTSQLKQFEPQEREWQREKRLKKIAKRQAVEAKKRSEQNKDDTVLVQAFTKQNNEDVLVSMGSESESGSEDQKPDLNTNVQKIAAERHAKREASRPKELKQNLSLREHVKPRSSNQIEKAAYSFK